MCTIQENSSTALYVPRRNGKKLPQYIAALSTCMGSLASGAVIGWTGNISEDMKKLSYNGIKIDDDILGWVGSLVTLGAATACFPMGKFCDLIGRKFSMLFLTIPFTIGWLLIIFANSLPMLYIGRFLTGMACSGFCVSAPIYISEIAEKDIRGKLSSYYILLLCMGIGTAFAVAMIVDIKIYTIIMAILPLIFAVTFILQPESPVYLIMCNKEKEARNALKRLRGKTYAVDEELEEIKKGVTNGKQGLNLSVLESLKKKGTQTAFIVCFSLMIIQQAIGINAVLFYTETIFKAAGSNINPKICTLIIGIVQASATFLSSMVVDRLGRRILLITSTFFVSIGSLSLGIYFTLQDRTIISESAMSTLGFLPITSLSIYVFTFSFGIAPVPWMVSAELFPPEVKSFGSAGAATLNCLTAFLVTKFYMNVKNAVGGDTTFYIFSLVAFLGTIFIYFYVPETKGKTLDEIQQELNRTDSGDDIQIK